VPAKRQPDIPEWSNKVKCLRESLKLSQSEFGQKLGVSAMSLSRWERGTVEPPEGAYIRLGNLAGNSLRWYFWKRAGLTINDIREALPDEISRLAQSRTVPLQIAHAGINAKSAKEKSEFVAVPLLPVIAATPGEKGDTDIDLDQIPPEKLLPASKEWCPHPEATVCLRVKGNSMSPLILDDYIIAVDTSEVRHEKLVGTIVVAQHTKKGLLVSRLIRFDHTDALVSDRREYDSVSVTVDSHWRIVGQVLWWIGKAR